MVAYHNKVTYKKNKKKKWTADKTDSIGVSMYAKQHIFTWDMYGMALSAVQVSLNTCNTGEIILKWQKSILYFLNKINVKGEKIKYIVNVLK